MNERDRFLARLAAGPLLADGAMGTLLYSRGIPQRANLDELVATRPEIIGAIHREYLEAGAELIETATFGANRVRLAAHGMNDRAGAFNRRGAQLAREARDVVGHDAWVAGSVGPLGAPTRELVRLGEPAVRAAVREQLDGLLEGGVDLFVFETFSLLDHLLLAIDEARHAADLPIVAQLTFGEELQLPDGTTPQAAAIALAAAGADVIGVNCGGGPEACVEALEAIAESSAASASPRSIMPNAGLPRSGSRASSSTPPARTTWPGWCRASWRQAGRCSAAAAGRRRSTSPRCDWPSTRSRQPRGNPGRAPPRWPCRQRSNLNRSPSRRTPAPLPPPPTHPRRPVWRVPWPNAAS
jgi:Methionine synthase I (cobalamin-dependent), methyltransferase domain